jgi:hypothetical protein
MRVTRNRAALAGTSVLAAGVLGLLGSQVIPASAAEQYNHFIRISVNEVYQYPWSADAILHDGSGREVYHWHEDHESGDYVLWRYYANPGDTLDISMSQTNGTDTFTRLDATQDNCFILSGLGASRQISPCRGLTG